LNIFYLDYNVKKCAEQHVDKHTVKMIVEYAQLLSTAHRYLDGDKLIGLSKTGRKQTRYVLSNYRESILYSATHINHPSAIWARSGAQQYRWLHDLLIELCKEYTYRYGKIHKVEHSGLLAVLDSFPKKIPIDVEWSEPTPAMPDEYKVKGDSKQSYMRYYIYSKSHLAKWKNRNVPEWFKNGEIKFQPINS
jgi:hypothetical protein